MSLKKKKFKLEPYDIVYKSGTTPLFPAVLLVQGYAWPFEEVVGLPPKPKPPMLTIVKDNITYWLFAVSEARSGRFFSARLFSQPDYWKKCVKREQIISRKILREIKTPVERLFTNHRLNAAGERKLRRLFTLYGQYGYAIDIPVYLFQLYYQDEMQKVFSPWLKKYPVKEQDEIFHLLLSGPRLTNSEKFTLKLNQHILERRGTKDIKSLAAEFYWFVHDYLGQEIDERVVRSYLLERQERTRQELRQEIQEIKERLRAVRALTNALPPRLKRFAKQMQEMTFIYTERKKSVVNRASAWLRRVTERRFPGKSLDKLYELHQLTPEEMLSVLKGASLPDVKTRCRAWVFSTDRNGIRSGDIRYLELVRPRQNKETLQGRSACAGKVSGQVHIVTNASQIGKFKAGEILVAPFTTVAYVPIMRKAKAVLTEIGGLTSHAAIVSRELKKPCIVGIPHLLTVLNDGDKVEVDAINGIVRKL